MPQRSRRLLWRFGATLVLAAFAAGVLYALVRPASPGWPAASTPSLGPAPSLTSSPSPTTRSTARSSPRLTRTTLRPTTTQPSVVPLAPQPPVLDRWHYASTTGGVLGTAGPVRTFRVAVEDGLPVTADEFTQVVDTTLGDPRGWVGSGTVRLRHVAGRASANFTIYLATAQTAFELCLAGDVDITIDGVPYTSCRVGSKVVINADRYTQGVPNYVAPLADYRQYVINHEVGHWLGHDHIDCPGAGQPAPVMQQQTLGLQGCVANSWPLLVDAL